MCLDISEGGLSGSKDEEEPSEISKTKGSFEYKEEEALDGATSYDDLSAHLRPGKDCSVRRDRSEEC